MKSLTEWPYEPVDKKRHFNSPEYEWAYMKAALDGKPNDKTTKAYTDFFGEPPKKNLPGWFIRLVIYYTALELGHQRVKKSGGGLNASERAMLACLRKLNVELLKSNRHLWHYMYLHDVEPIRGK